MSELLQKAQRDVVMESLKMFRASRNVRHLLKIADDYLPALLADADAVDVLRADLATARAELEEARRERDAMAFAMRVLRVSSFGIGHDDCDSYFWRCDGEYAPITFIVRCSDTFAYACADAEAVTPENVAVLEQAYADAAASCDVGAIYGSTLFCARVRRMKPVPAFLKNLDPALVALFDACESDPAAMPGTGEGNK